MRRAAPGRGEVRGQHPWAARQLEMTDLGRKSRTVLRLEKLEYNLPLKDGDFTVQALRRDQ